jgi:choline dehydrogenase
MNGDFDYVIVGSGAGGGPLAANLARAGFKVLLLDAGGDPCATSDLGRYMYEVPIFNGLATEYNECAWDYFVRHYADTDQQKRDSKYVADQDGIWYPRAGTLGGCTAHNAMITVIPQNQDWDHIAELTGDNSWAGEKMRGYFERLENCQYVARPGTLAYDAEGIASSITELIGRREDWRDWHHGHGFNGWLTTSEADPRLVLKDHEVVDLLLNGVVEVLRDHIGDAFLRVETRLDPNDSRNCKDSPEGLSFTPLAVANGKRNGPREYLLRTKKEYPANLTIQLDALATRILFEGTRAIGVEFLEGRHLYKADPEANGENPTGPPRQVRAAREVILAAGAFNSPQLLMLSGVGPSEQLKKLGIPCVADLPGVGENLQDRYEVAVISELRRPFELLEGASFEPPQGTAPVETAFAQWEQGKGLYASNGTLIGIIKRSTKDKIEPDLYIFGLPGTFKGYVPGYSAQFERYRNRFTWAILKAHTNNTAGRVRLRSKNPLDTPSIDFHYFSEGNDKKQADLDAVAKGVEFVRDMNQHLGAIIGDEEWPGTLADTPEKLREFIQNEAWGHHASCTNKIGVDADPMAVLDSRFRVRKTQGLRVVDASVFPRIPGYFIVSAVYMISEKAFDVIVEDGQSGRA